MTAPIRIGQIVPRSNTTMETEVPAMNAQGVRCAAELADARVDVMSTACLVALNFRIEDNLDVGRSLHRAAHAGPARAGTGSTSGGSATGRQSRP